MALDIYVVEADNAETFRIYDRTVWVGYDNTLATSVVLNVLYDGDTYTVDITALVAGGSVLGGATSVNLMGTSVNSYYEVTPDELLNGAVPLDAEYFPDGYYEITLAVTYDGGALTDTSEQGFLSEIYQMASQLPLQMDLNNFNYEENRLQFMCIALLQSCKWAGELGRSSQFTTFSDKVNEFLDARDISRIWTT